MQIAGQFLTFVKSLFTDTLQPFGQQQRARQVRALIECRHADRGDGCGNFDRRNLALRECIVGNSRQVQRQDNLQNGACLETTRRDCRIGDLGNIDTLQRRHVPDEIVVERIERSGNLQSDQTLLLGFRDIAVERPGRCNMHGLVTRSFLGEQDALAHHSAGIAQFDRSVTVGSVRIGLEREIQGFGMYCGTGFRGKAHPLPVSFGDIYCVIDIGLHFHGLSTSVGLDGVGIGRDADNALGNVDETHQRPGRCRR